MTANEFCFNPENVPELRHVLPQQYTEIGQGAQFRVYMLTDPDLSRSELPDDEYVVPRVVKESLNSYETALYVRDKIGITDPLEQAEKVAQLTIGKLAIFGVVMNLARLNHRENLLSRYLGDPAPIFNSSPSKPPAGHFTSPCDYTQVYGKPVNQLVEKLDWNNALHRRLGRYIVDQYIDIEETLWPQGYFDTTYKLADNFVVSEDAQLTMADFSELSNNRLRVEESIANKEWEQVHNQRESSQLPPYLFDYFCDQLDIRFNSLIRAEWGTGIASRLDMLAHPMLRPMHDVEGTVLWNARPGRNLHTSIAAIDPDLDSTVGILAYRRVQERLLYEPPAFIFEQGIA